MTMVKCPDCNIRWDKTAKGNQHRCPPCYRVYTKAYRARRKAGGNPIISSRPSPERNRERQRAYYENPEHRERRNANMRQHQKNPELRPRHEARWKVRREIEAGRLTRQPCEVCGAAPADAHHDDYSKPLEVRWLCRPHHREHHNRATEG